jgi:hypothetical protein
MSLSTESQDVSTTLNYLIRPDSEQGLRPIGSDSVVDESERRMAQRDGVDKAQRVVIHDIRGREKEFALNVQGFQYVQHEVKGVTDWTDREQIKTIIQPATEELVKK